MQGEKWDRKMGHQSDKIVRTCADKKKMLYICDVKRQVMRIESQNMNISAISQKVVGMMRMCR